MLDIQHWKEQRDASSVGSRLVAAWLEDRKILLLSPGQDNVVNKDVITTTILHILSVSLVQITQ